MTFARVKLGLRFALIALALVVAALVLVVYPMYVIQPFKYQDQRQLQIALRVTRWRAYVEIAICAAAWGLLIRYWRQQSRWMFRSLATLGTLAVMGAAWLSRINVYEIMFRPNGQPSFTEAARVKLDKDEKVMAVLIGGVARAYPIRSVSYHHVINDTVGGVPIVATY